MYWYLLGENLYWLLLGPEGLRLTICCSCRSPERVRNPHLRAKLAETLEALIPVNRSQNSSGLLSPSSVNMVCIRNLETCAGFQPLPKILPRLHPQSLILSAILQEDYLWFSTISGFFLGFIFWGRSPQWPTATRFLGGSPEILEMNMRWDAIWCVLRHNFEKCYSVCTELVASGWFFR